jgi:hypothetical protein
MKTMGFDAPLPWTENTLYEWFVENVDGITFDKLAESSGCCKPERVIGLSFQGLRLQTDKWIDPGLERTYGLPSGDPRETLRGEGIYPLIVLLVHLARYSELGGYSCLPEDSTHEGLVPFGFDRTLAESGPWGVEYWYLRWLADHSDPSFLNAPGDDPDLYRTIAGQDAQTILETRFCDSAPSTEGPAALLELEAWAE